MSTYGPDHAAAMAGALRQWKVLSPTMQTCLRWAYEDGPGLAPAGTSRTKDALIDRGLVSRESRLTPMGLLVREVGVAAEHAAKLVDEALRLPTPRRGRRRRPGFST